jgi:predicted metal-dependent peptidase
MNKFEQCALTPQQEKAWDMTRTALVWNCPAFSHIFYTLLNNAGSKHIALFTKDVPIAAVDGSNLILNPETFFKYSLNERVFACAHEILHCVLNHCVMSWGFYKRGKISYPDGSELPYIHKVANIAQDLVINDILIESKVGDFNKDWLHDTSIGTAKDAWIDVYKKVFEQQDAAGNIQRIKGSQFDEHLEPGASQGKDPGQAAQQRNEAQWQTEIAAAAASARAQGKLPAGLERLFQDILNPQVDWREHIAALFARKVGSGSFDWRRPDRRLIVRDIYAPGPSGHGAGTIVVGVDTSGSIGPKQLDMFFAEMSGILEDLRPKRVLVMWCDAEVHRVDEAEDPGDLNSIRCAGAPGGGGTSFVPVFNEIEKQGLEPDALVYLTDGMGSFPEQSPRYTVIWGSICDTSKYPFGDVVNIKNA